MGINVNLIAESFKAVKPHADDFADHFYEELFTRHPGAKALFIKSNMPKQKKALMASLTHIVEFWTDQDHLKDYLFKMGQRHVKYHAEEAHFPLVAEALLATFEYFFEGQWTNELKESWVGVYQFVQTHMSRGMAAAHKKLDEAEKKQTLGIDDFARQMARDAFKKALEEEADAIIEELARSKAKEILRKALETEAKEVLRSVVRKAA